MFVTNITIRRANWYTGRATPDSPFMATVEVQGETTKTEMKLDAEMSARIVAIVADEIAASGRATAEAMVAEVITGQTLLAAE